VEDGASHGAIAYALAKLEAGDPSALGGFAALVGVRPADALAQYHLKRLLNGAIGTRIEMA
jgi:adenylate cyclase